MYEILKAISQIQIGQGQNLTDQYNFTYARRDFANLYNEVEVDKPHIFLDPEVITTNFSTVNVVESNTYEGSFLLVVNSDLDEVDYDTRYQTYIKPLLDGALVQIRGALACSYPATINTWRTTEVINIFDYNLDGILVNYNITIDV